MTCLCRSRFGTADHGARPNRRSGRGLHFILGSARSLRTDGNGAVFHQRTGSGAQVEGHAGGDGQDPGISQRSELSDRGGDLRLFVLKNRPSCTPTKAGRLCTLKRGQQKDILLDMARRAQPVIREIEARKHWSVMNTASSAQDEMFWVPPQGWASYSKGTSNGRDFGSDPLRALVRPMSGGGQVEVPLKGPMIPPKEVKKGGSVSEAIRISKMGSFQRILAIFRTSARSRAPKRAEMIKLVKSIKGSNNILPLSKELVESVSAALRESGMKSGPQYLVELKLTHVEAGYEVEAWLKRTFDLCRKALERSRGPAVRAAEVKLSYPCGMPRHWKPGQQEKGCQRHQTWHLPGHPGHQCGCSERLSCAIWRSAISLFLARKGGSPFGSQRPRWISRARALGAPFDAAERHHVRLYARGLWDGKPLRSPRTRGRCPDLHSSRHGMTWRKPPSQTRSRLGGHIWFLMFQVTVPEGRGQCIMWEHAGLPIQELAFLGRWKSNVVLTYAEEALQERVVTGATWKPSSAFGRHRDGSPSTQEKTRRSCELHHLLQLSRPWR